jgi:cytochrome c-type biogenesis protein CcmH
MIWAVLIVMTAIAASAVLLPYLRRRPAPAPRAAYDLEIYRDQLAEVERDQARGLIESNEADAARLEIARRALAADAAAKDAAPAAPSPAPRARAPRLVLAAAAAAPLLAVAIYLGLGSPGLPSHVFMAAHVQRGEQDAELVAKLEARLKEHPDEVEGWVLLARSYRTLGRADDAVRAWREAIKRAANPIEYASLFGEALVQAADGTVTPEAQSRFAAALTADPADPRARYYLGLAQAQAGESRAALQAWVDLVAISPPDAPWLPLVREGISRVAAEAKVDLASITPSPEAQQLAHQAPSAAPPAATAPPAGMPPNAAAIQAMPPEQRMAMIRNMVDQLAARLEGQPDDVDGWLRLGRARHVLGEEDKSLAAYAKAASLAPDRLDTQTTYAEALAGQLQPDEKPPENLIALMRHILALDPNNGDALWYVGMAEAEAGHHAEAIQLWQRLITQLPQGGKERDQVQGQIDQLKKQPN